MVLHNRNPNAVTPSNTRITVKVRKICLVILGAYHDAVFQRRRVSPQDIMCRVRIDPVRVALLLEFLRRSACSYWYRIPVRRVRRIRQAVYARATPVRRD